MKIKEVQEKTGLTDRAVRFYMENGLVLPDHHENYQGRRNFQFSEEDVSRLSDIALLRSAGFSVDQIKRLFDGEEPKVIVRERTSALKNKMDRDEKTFRALSSLEDVPDYDLQALTAALKNAPEQAEIPKSDSEPPYKRMYHGLKKKSIVFAIVFAGILLLVVVFLGLAPYLRAGITSVYVYENGKLLETDHYYAAQRYDSDSENKEYRALWSRRGYYAFSDYGPNYGTVTLSDGFRVDFGCWNLNNWNKVRISLYIERGEDGGKVKQVLWINGDRYENEAFFSASDDQCSVISNEG